MSATGDDLELDQQAAPRAVRHLTSVADLPDELLQHRDALAALDALLDGGELGEAEAQLRPAVAEDPDSRAVLALVRALEGQAKRATSLLHSTDVRELSQPCRVARIVTDAIVQSQTVSVGWRPRQIGHPSIDGGAEDSPALQICLRVLRATNRAGTWLDTATATNPLASRLLVALGILDVVTLAGTPVPVGGPAEQVLARLRTALASGDLDGVIADRSHVLLDLQDVHPRTRIELASIVAVAAESLGREDDAVTALTVAIAVATETGTMAPLLEHAQHLEQTLTTLSTAPTRDGTTVRRLISG